MAGDGARERRMMRAGDVMTGDVVTVGPEARVDEIGRLMLAHHISAVPVVDATGQLLGIVSEGDLVRRAETGTLSRRAWWLELLRDPAAEAREYVKTHGRRAADVMTRPVVTVAEDTAIEDIAGLLERRGIKRVPVVREGRVIGIVSRADLVRALAVRPVEPPPPGVADDRAIRDGVLAALRTQPWWVGTYRTVVVVDGVVHLWGLARSPAERDAMRVAAETVPGVRGVEDHLMDWRAWSSAD
jgi:CBS domain-containing protein